MLGTEGNFHFLALPEGDHTVSYLSLPDPAIGQASIEDSARVYSLNRPISSLSSDTLSVTELDFQVPMPEQFKN